MHMNKNFIELRGLKVVKSGKTILDVKQFSVKKGEVMAVIGPNGAGKSTLLKILGLLEKPLEGVFLLNGEAARVGDLKLRRQITMVFQEALLLDTTVRANLCAGLRFRKLPSREIKKRVIAVSERFKIKKLLHRPARSLSGGEAQRVVLARAFAIEPQLLLLDEPFASLDLPARTSLLEQLKDVLKETNVTAVFVTHDMNEIPYLADRLVVLSGGIPAQIGLPEDIFYRPATEEIASLVGVDNILSGQVEGRCGKLSRVRLGSRTTFFVKGCFDKGQRISLLIRAEEIEILTGFLNIYSAKNDDNVFYGTIKKVTPSGSAFKITLDCGFPLVVNVARKLVFGRELAKGKKVRVMVPVGAIHVLPDRGSLLGERQGTFPGVKGVTC